MIVKKVIIRFTEEDARKLEKGKVILIEPDDLLAVNNGKITKEQLKDLPQLIADYFGIPVSTFENYHQDEIVDTLILKPND